MKLAVLLASAFVALAAPMAARAQTTATTPAIDASLKEFAAELDDAATAPDFVGLAVAVIQNGQIAMVRTYGVRAAGGNERVTPDTVFRIASLSKGFAGTLAAMEMADGKFKLTDKIAPLVPQFHLKKPADTAAVTIEDVLSHRTGLPPFAYDKDLEAGMKPDEILGRYAQVKPVCEPHDCFAYQNTAFNMIARVIELTTGRQYGQELQARILTPLGLHSTSVGMAGLTSSGNWARPHRRVGLSWVPTTVKQPYYLLPAAGGVNASVLDMAHWMIAQMGLRPDVLSPAILDEVHKPRVDTPTETSRQRALRTPVKSTEYGLGFRTFNYAGHTLITHSGGVEGYLAQIAWLPESKSGIVILSNTRGTRAGKILPAWLDYELGLPKTDWFRMGDIALGANPPANASGD
ncbi:MAG TPA: serine hydrolase domain-containing protein [Hyphomonadaceae bacterium]|nr:serine hydrolase domain-containing protein [Hyphomonadaceae bacterium]